MNKDKEFKNYNKLIKSLSVEVPENIKASDIKMLNPQLLAYIGDAVYELFIRTFLATKGHATAGELHKNAILFVEAKAQAHIINKLYECLNHEEKQIVKRGRNTKTTSMPKNAKLIDYKYATGFESLLGSLYLNNNIERLLEVLNYAVEIMGGAI